MQEACLPHQFGLSTRAGNEALYKLLHTATALDPHATVLSVEAIGAFDHVCRQAMLDGLRSSPRLKPLFSWMTLTSSRPPNALRQPAGPVEPRAHTIQRRNNAHLGRGRRGTAGHRSPPTARGGTAWTDAWSLPPPCFVLLFCASSRANYLLRSLRRGATARLLSQAPDLPLPHRALHLPLFRRARTALSCRHCACSVLGFLGRQPACRLRLPRGC